MFTNELNWLKYIIEWRIQRHFGHSGNREKNLSGNIPELSGQQKHPHLSSLAKKYRFGREEELILILALTPHLNPNFLDDVFRENLKNSGDFPQLGGIKGTKFRGFIPTGETASFLLAGEDLQGRNRLQHIFSEEHPFAQQRILWLEDVTQGEPRMSGRIIINPDIVDQLLTGKVSRPRFSTDFPAEYITTELEDKDMVLSKSTRAKLQELQNWLSHQDILMNRWNLKRWVKPGYRALFHGPPGTGKTLAATILGKNTERDVFRIDLSMVVSKFIGETEKNLSQLFSRAQNKEWILFFDEADALFGKRTSVRDAHDKYANQEVAYLLQRIENHNGLVILASNFKSNIDEAFIRRFQSVIYFPPPTAEERYLLWKKTLPARKGLRLPTDEELKAIAKKYEITGAGIVNVMQYCALDAIAGKKSEITTLSIQTGIEREYQKEGKVF
ncbi:MAG: ATP-binding protein [Bacteroidia bacterium]|nr:MAG: ATP-binding protein [Bacteroidia bacterium]